MSGNQIIHYDLNLPNYVIGTLQFRSVAKNMKQAQGKDTPHVQS